jgi:TPR repeat protein
MDATVFDKSTLPGGIVAGRPICAILENVKFGDNQNVAVADSETISATGAVLGIERLPASECATVIAVGMKQFRRMTGAHDLDSGDGGLLQEYAGQARSHAPAAKRKLSVMRIAKPFGTLALLLALACGSAGPVSARDTTFVSAASALEQGIGAYKAGHYQIAVPALTFAADAGEFFGIYYLAQVYTDNNSAYTDHGKAYKLFLRIVDENANADPDDDQRAPYVGKALTAVASYTRRGLPEIALSANAERAAKFFRDSATFFRDSDAQFELAKMHLKGEGVAQDRRQAFHWLSTLTQEGHAGAQAFLADLLWRGKDLPKDEKRALALIRVAVANAPERDRIWIEDIYQNIFCGASSGTRQDADGLVAVWKRLYSPRSAAEPGDHLGLGIAERTCGNGEPLPLPGTDTVTREGRQTDGSRDQRTPASTVPETKSLQGGAASGLREIGAGRR